MQSQAQQKPEDIKKPSVIIPNELEEGEGEEAEVVAQVTVAPDGGWGWVVLVASFCSLVIVDGIVYSFGPILPDLAKDLAVSESVGVLVNSVQGCTYFIFSPFASGLVNRFGFRVSGMVGSIVCSMSAFAASYSRNYVAVLILYGFINGLGCSMNSLASNVIVGFYFQNLRSIVMPIVSGGSSVGIMLMYQLNLLAVDKAGWKTALLLHSGLFGSVFFLALTYRPLLTITVIPTEEEGNPTRTVTYLPNVSTARVQTSPSGVIQKEPTATERLMRAVSNARFPTAKSFIEDVKVPVSPGQPGTSTVQSTGVSRIILKTQNSVSRQQLQKMQSIISSRNIKEITIEVDEQPRDKSCFGRCCHWQKSSSESRPMYRDDIFYNGQIKKLPAYQKSIKDLPEDKRTGLEYQLEVSRAVTVDDLRERRGVFTTAVRRVLATMLDLSLLKRNSYVAMCLAGLFLNSGAFVPYLFIQNRGETNGLDAVHASLLVSVISISNLIGRLVTLLLALKIKAVYVVATCILITGISTMVSGISYTPTYQYGYCIIFGMSIAASTSLRGVILTEMYGLENLSNGFGIILMFNGVAFAYCTPLGAYMINRHGYDLAFYVAGGFMTVSGILSFLVKPLQIREEKRKRHRESGT